MSNEQELKEQTQWIMGTGELDLSSIISVTTQIDNKGIAILFTFIDDETSIVEASITDNYVESNHSIQDHIAIKPRIYRLRGCVGEVIYSGSSEWLKWLEDQVGNHPLLKKTLDYMQPIANISGVVSSATQSAINIINHLENSYNRYRKMLDNFLNSKQNQLLGRRQELTVADLNRILELRIPVNLKGLKFETTFTAGDNYERKYYLQSVSAHQGSNNFISDIEVTIKEFRIATTKLTSPDPQKYGGTKIDTSATQKATAGNNNNGSASTQKISSPKELAESGWSKAETIQAPQKLEAQEGQLVKPGITKWFNEKVMQFAHRNDYKDVSQMQGRDVMQDLVKIKNRASSAMGNFKRAYGIK